jgi:hypothetical protein
VVDSRAGPTAPRGLGSQPPEEWVKGRKSENKHAHLAPIAGDRGAETQIAYSMVKAAGYVLSKGDSDDELTQKDCIAIPIGYLVSTHKIDSGSGRGKVHNEHTYSATARKKYIWS